MKNRGKRVAEFLNYRAMQTNDVIRDISLFFNENNKHTSHRYLKFMLEDLLVIEKELCNGLDESSRNYELFINTAKIAISDFSGLGRNLTDGHKNFLQKELQKLDKLGEIVEATYRMLPDEDDYIDEINEFCEYLDSLEVLNQHLSRIVEDLKSMPSYYEKFGNGYLKQELSNVILECYSISANSEKDEKEAKNLGARAFVFFNKLCEHVDKANAIVEFCQHFLK